MQDNQKGSLGSWTEIEMTRSVRSFVSESHIFPGFYVSVCWCM